MTENISLLYRFAPEVTSIEKNGNILTLHIDAWKPLSFSVSRPVYVESILALQGDGATIDQIKYPAMREGNIDEGLKAVNYYIERFSRARLIHWDLRDDIGSLATVRPLAAGYRPRLDTTPGEKLSLCRFAFLHKISDGIALESGLVPACILFNKRGLKILSKSLAQPSLAEHDEMSALLWRLGFFDIENPKESTSRKCWEFHDKLMHETSRFNRDLPVGATYRFENQFPSAPAIKPTMAGERVKLPNIDMDNLINESHSLLDVQDSRKSIRTYSNQPINILQISKFLWRVARTTSPLMKNSHQELISRTYPAGGSINELEFYIAVRRCEGLDTAFYHYDSHNHTLIRLADTEKITQKIIEGSSLAMGIKPEEQQPDITIVVSSRLPRLAWKYERMAYRASLLHAGVVIQLMYLVATDMNLAPCANGSGNSRLFEQATGLDQFEETSIAEFCLGLPA